MSKHEISHSEHRVNEAWEDNEVTLRALLDAQDYTNPLFLSLMRDVSGVQSMAKILDHLMETHSDHMPTSMMVLMSAVIPVLKNASIATLALINAAGFCSEDTMDEFSIRTDATEPCILAEISPELSKAAGLLNGDLSVALENRALDMYVIVPTAHVDEMRAALAPLMESVYASTEFKEYIDLLNEQKSRGSKDGLFRGLSGMMIGIMREKLQREVAELVEPVFNEIQSKIKKAKPESSPMVAPAPSTLQ